MQLRHSRLMLYFFLFLRSAVATFNDAMLVDATPGVADTVGAKNKTTARIKDMLNLAASSFPHSTVTLFLCGMGVVDPTGDNSRDALMGFNRHLTVYIPSSRVGDGICDCCDGSDEDKPNSTLPPEVRPACPNTCEALQSSDKQAALAFHRNVQAGMRAKTEIVENFKAKKRAEREVYTRLSEEKKVIMKLLITMRFMLRREIPFETELRWKLLRERENRCAEGEVEGACGYFLAGYYNDQELIDEGIPAVYAKPKMRFHYEYSADQISLLQKLSGLERVRQSICLVRDILPDPDARIFTIVGEFVDFANTIGGKVDQKTRNRRVSRNTLFERYLDHGEKGWLLFKLTLLEGTGLLLSPVILTLQMVSHAIHYMGEQAWELTRRCAINNLAGNVEEGETATSADDALSTDYTSNAMQSDIFALPVQLVQICRLIIQSDEDDSPVATLLGYLDYTQYSVLVSLSDFLGEKTESLQWMWEIIWRAPRMYLDYFILRKDVELPPSRRACLLRHGIESAERELAGIEEQINIQMQLFPSIAEEEAEKRDLIRWIKFYFELYYPRIKDALLHGFTRPKQRESGQQQQMQQKQQKKLAAEHYIDFGLDRSWEAWEDTCIHSSLPLTTDATNSSAADYGDSETPPQYNYTICLFGEVSRVSEQDGHVTSLGRFIRWGAADTPLSLSAAGANLQAASSTSIITSLENGAGAGAGATGVDGTMGAFVVIPEASAAAMIAGRSHRTFGFDDLLPYPYPLYQTHIQQNTDGNVGRVSASVSPDGDITAASDSSISSPPTSAQAPAPSSVPESALDPQLLFSSTLLQATAHWLAEQQNQQQQRSLNKRNTFTIGGGSSSGSSREWGGGRGGVPVPLEIAAAARDGNVTHLLTGLIREFAHLPVDGGGVTAGPGSDIELTGSNGAQADPRAQVVALLHQWYSYQVYDDGAICDDVKLSFDSTTASSSNSSRSSSSSSSRGGEESKSSGGGHSGGDSAIRRWRTEVRFECSMHSEIHKVIAVESCFHQMIVTTPLACTQQLEDASMQHLEGLGLFGFSRSRGKTTTTGATGSRRKPRST